MINEEKQIDKGVAWTATKLFVLAVIMFAFCFVVMVPLYDVLCSALGINGKTQGKFESAEQVTVDKSRTIKVQFVASNNAGMVWQFHVNDAVLEVHPGESVHTSFYAKNPTSSTMTAQAIPSLSPARATKYFHKTECFCFNQQTFAGHEEADMPLVFMVDTNIPEDINTITLSYTLFDVTNGFKHQDNIQDKTTMNMGEEHHGK